MSCDHGHPEDQCAICYWLSRSELVEELYGEQ